MKTFVILMICTFTHSALSAKKVKGAFEFHGLENHVPHQYKSKVIDAQFKTYLGGEKATSIFSADKNLVSRRIDRIDQAMAAHKSHDKKIPFTLKDKGIKYLSAARVATLKFPSQYKLLDQAGKDHPRRNMVHAKIYYGYKTHQQPTNFVVMLPHTNDSIGKLEVLAKSIVASTTGNVSIAILIPPLYKKRGLDSDKISVVYGNDGVKDLTYLSPKFIVPDYESSFHNIAQTIIDIYTLQLFLKQWKLHPDIPMGLAREKMTLGGLSLGGIVALSYAGLIGGFEKYFSLVGGSNIPLFLDNLIRRRDIVLAISKTFDDAGWTFRDSIQSFLPWDPILWAHRVDSEILMVNACNDEFLKPKEAILNLQDVFQNNSTKVISKWNHWGHNPVNASKLSLYFKFIEPFGRFAMDGPVLGQIFEKKCR